MYILTDISDGNSIPITNTGHSIIPAYHRPLHLHSVLVTPNIIKNLKFVCQFNRDNNCTIEFDAFGFSVKDFLTRRILLRCDSSGDLYPVIKPSTLPVAFVSTRFTTWHQRLGHPEYEVLCSLSSCQFISCNKAKSTHVCHACQLGKHVKLPFHSSNSLVKQSFDIIHSDLWTYPIHPITLAYASSDVFATLIFTRSQRGIVKPLERLSLHTSSVSLIPKSPFLAWKDPNWCNAMYDEYNALVKNGTWILVPRPDDANLVRSMWLFKHKFHADGMLSRYKARLVANGSSQQLEVDFDETFSSIVKPATIRTPPGFVDSRYPNHGSQVVYLLIYVGDIILAASSPVLLQQIVDSLHKEFDMTDIGTLNYFLGNFIVRHPTGLFLSQHKYALQLLERAHMVNCNPSRTPVDNDSKLGPDGVLFRILLYTVVLQEGFSILPLLVQICPMQFNRVTDRVLEDGHRSKMYKVEPDLICSWEPDLVTKK
nr:ribonuclease H-like domain-containing protein [Tanacetum cinerariifolium]